MPLSPTFAGPVGSSLAQAVIRARPANAAKSVNFFIWESPFFVIHPRRVRIGAHPPAITYTGSHGAIPRLPPARPGGKMVCNDNRSAGLAGHPTG
jgi:hypothetical protein